ncbi:MAG TPA: LPS export ABC transporter periplasmic protein LptC [Bosea sp. (in: a-proteobacteria)]|jgi:lipopolysaccharide export system protein LptC|uniref:LPS export ABC transporter periplasmic protein LptC n=1 Tax=Bosea sp. (in: a-proteobacteria) TaxID=1871050 RepID=UPI002DDD0684|nr:LPS export ABC transporter periplasmic protein LptC [Bosea sp. (in: a-proteobacteria)]HEV2553580.1 LPS export ABC transporter periplasmic protein LptC [Bosea sp. (in: a-proteobacteria)]
MTSHDWPTARVGVPGARRQAAFGAARRHTRLVRFLRRAIPISASVAVLALIVTPFLNPLNGVASLSLGAVGISGGKVKMDTPRLSGYRTDNRPYEVTAEAALQEIRNPTQVELQTLTARLQMEREGWVTVNAKSGLFDTQKEKLRLVDDVHVRTENGHDIRMRTADVDFKGGTVVSKEPVKVSLGTTTVDAESLDVKDNGALIVFQGRVRAYIPNAPAGTIAGPEREGSTPALELLRPAQAAVGDQKNGTGQ